MAYKPLTSLEQMKFPPAPMSRLNNYPVPTPSPLPQYKPMGTPAKSPQTNIEVPKNTITPDKANIPPAVVPKPDTGISTPPPQNNAAVTYPGLVGQIANIGQNGTPEYNKANDDLLNFKKQYADYQTRVGSESNPFGFQTGVGRLAADRYSQLLPAYEQNVTNTLAGGNQRLSALGSATGAATPVQVSPGNFYVSPLSGQDISGGSINPGTGGARQSQVSQGKEGQDNVPKINTAAGYVNQVNQLLQTGGFNQSDLNVYNLLHNIAASNVSNPEYPKLQQAFNNALTFYAQVLGQDPNQLLSTLASTGKASTVSGALANLDKMAREYNQQVIASSQNQNPTPVTVQPTNFPQNSPGQVVEGQGTYQGMQFRIEPNGAYTRIK